MAGRFDIEEERKLLLAAQRGDIEARRQLHIKFKGMLDTIVNQTFYNSPQPKIAIRIEAEKLLDTFIDSWSPAANNKPVTYLMGNVKNKLKRYTTENANPVRITEHYAIHVKKYKDSLAELTTQLNRKPDDIEIANHMNMRHPGINFSTKDIERFRASVRTTSLGSTTIGTQEEGTSLFMGDVVFSEGEDDPMEDYLADVKVIELMGKVNTLPEPKRTIVLNTFGLNGFQKLSLRSLALKLGINKYRVQAYLKEAMDELQIK